MYHNKYQQKLQTFDATTIDQTFCEDLQKYNHQQNHHNDYVHFGCVDSKHHNIWFSCLFVLIAMILMINDKSLVTGAPAKLETKGFADTTTSESPKYTELPDYILSLNDPDIGGPVEYVFILDDGGSKSVAWDLLPPLFKSLDHDTKPASNEHNYQRNNGNHFTTTMDYNTSSGLSHKDQTENNYSTAKTPTSTTVTGGVFATKTPHTHSTISHSAIHMRNTLSTSTAITKNVPSSTSGTLIDTTAIYGDELLKLPGGNSKILPSWLIGIDDPDLDVAVPYEIPADIYSYQPTIETDLVPPFEPYTDLNEPAFTSSTPKHSDIVNHIKATQSIAAISTTRNPSTVTTNKVHWSHWTKPYTTTTTTKSPKTRIATTTTTLKTSSHTSRRIGTSPTGKFISELLSAGSTHHTTKSFNNYTSRTITSTIPTINTTSTTTTAKPTITFKPKTTRTPTPTTTTTTTTATTTTKTASKILGTTFRPLTTSSTIAPDLDGNPFEPTIPPWLKDFDYPDVGPGVPFIYDPSADDDDSDHTAVASETNSQRVVPTTNALHGAANVKKSFPSDQSNVATPLSTLQQPIHVHYERFPPYFNVTTSYDVPLIPTKTAYSKTNDGRFLGNNQVTNGAGSAPGILTNQQPSNSFQGKGFPRISVDFGGSPGVLAPHGTSTLQKGTIGTHHSALSNTNKEPYHNMHKILSTFGAPPGILTPYDNKIKSKF